jgi:hypothetical protein
MHPEIVQRGPGVCPLCGMALEPRVVSLDDEDAPNPELDDMLRRLRVSAAFTAPLFILAMSDLLPGAPVQHALSPRTLAWIQLALATPVVVWGARPFFERGWASIRSRSLNMFTLIALGTGVAYAYSVVATLAPEWIPAIGTHGVPLYFEAAADAARPAPSSRAQPHGTRSAACSASRRRRPGASTPTAPSTTSRSQTSRWAIGCASGRARRFPSTGSCSTERAPSTSRWSRASRSRSRRRPARR